MCIINFNLIGETDKWFDKIEAKKNKLWCSITELQYLIDEENN